MALPLPLLPFWTAPFTIVDADGFRPNISGSLTFYEYTEGTPTTLLDTYSDQTGDTVNTNPLIINSAGYPTSSGVEVPIFIQNTGYTVVMKDADGATLRTLRFVEDVGATFLAQTSVIQTQGTTATNSPYLVTADDNLVQINFGSSGTVQLPAAADRQGLPLVVKNLSGFTQSVMPQSGETIDGNTSAYVLPVQANPNYPTITLASDGVSAWFVLSSHAL